jgi:hypothetical protein
MSMTEEEMARRFRRALVPYRDKPVATAAQSAHIPSETEADKMALTFAEPIEETGENVLRPDWQPVAKSVDNLPRKPLKTNAVPVEKLREPSRLPWWLSAGLYVTAFTLFGAEVATNIWNAWGSDWSMTAIPLTIAIGASSGLFFTFALFKTVQGEWRLFPAVACAVFLAFALHNSFTLQATALSDRGQARAERTTTNAKSDLETAKDKRDAACDTKKPTQACQDRRGDVKVAQGGVTKATDASTQTARPEIEAFQKIAVWASQGRWKPSKDDFDNIGLLLRLIVLQMGGPVLLLARR